MAKGRGNRRRLKYSPQLFVAEDISIASAGTASSDSVYLVSDQTPVSIRFRKCTLSMTAGATATSNWFIIRRVPSGYGVPTSLTVATGVTSFIDAPDILGYAFVKAVGSASTTYEIEMVWLKPTITLYQGDQVVIQGTPSTNSTGNQFSAIMEFGVCYL